MGSLVEDVSLELPQRLTGIDPQLLGQNLTGPPQRGQCIPLSAAAVQPESQQPPPVFPQRLPVDLRLQVENDRRRTPQRQPSLGPTLYGQRPELVQPLHLPASPRLISELCVRRPSPSS